MTFTWNTKQHETHRKSANSFQKMCWNAQKSLEKLRQTSKKSLKKMHHIIRFDNALLIREFWPHVPIIPTPTLEKRTKTIKTALEKWNLIAGAGFGISIICKSCKDLDI